jgi:hypothetical protein
MCKKLFVVLLLLGVILPTTARATAIRPHDPANGNLIGYWKLDDTVGTTTAADSSNSGTHPAQVYDPNNPSQFTFDTGDKKVGTGAGKWLAANTGTGAGISTSFGINARLRLRNMGSVSPTMQYDVGTVAMWARLASDSPLSNVQNRFLWGFRATTGAPGPVNNRIQLYCSARGNEICVGMGPDNQLDKYITKLNKNQWYHFAFTWERDIGLDGLYRLYIDGNDQSSGLMTPGQLPGHYKNMNQTLPLTGDIGNTGANGSLNREGWYGSIDEVGLYNTVVSREDICYLAGADPNKAWDPVPDDNEGDPNMAKSPVTGHNFVPVDATLAWAAGKDFTSHDVYLGTNKADVSAATTASPLCVSQAQLDTTYTGSGFDANTIYYWRIDEKLSGAGTPNPAKGSVWKFHTALATGACIPEDNTVNVNADVALSWTAAGTVTAHRVYFGTDKARVTAATTVVTSYPECKGTQAKTLLTYAPFSLPTAATFNTNYYWRIDEITDIATYKGNTLTFTTSDYFTIDNFESYATTQAMQLVWATTIGTASRVLFLDTLNPVVFGSQYAMRVNGDGTAAGYYFGVRRDYGTNWDYTFGDLVKTMSVWYRCDSNTKTLQTKLTDANSTTAAVVLTSPTQNNDWHEWIIKLDSATFPSVYRNHISKIEVGDGNGVHASGTGSTDVYFDELRLYKTRYLQSQDGDVVIDGAVNWKDAKAIGSQWLAHANLASNPDFAGGISSGTIDDNAIPNNWLERYTIGSTTFPASDTGVPMAVSVVSGEGNPKTPAGRVILDKPQTQGGIYGSLIKNIDVTSLVGQTLEISFNYKGDLTVISPTTTTFNGPVNAFFEYREFCNNTAAFPSSAEGGPYPMREQRLGTGYKAWDWKTYSHTKLADYNYLHLNFALTGRGDPCTSPTHPRLLIVDHLIVKTVGSTVPTADINEDTYVNFDDYVTMADNWLESVPACPPTCG